MATEITSTGKPNPTTGQSYDVWGTQLNDVLDALRTDATAIGAVADAAVTTAAAYTDNALANYRLP